MYAAVLVSVTSFNGWLAHKCPLASGIVEAQMPDFQPEYTSALVAVRHLPGDGDREVPRHSDFHRGS